MHGIMGEKKKQESNPEGEVIAARRGLKVVSRCGQRKLTAMDLVISLKFGCCYNCGYEDAL